MRTAAIADSFGRTYRARHVRLRKAGWTSDPAAGIHLLQPPPGDLMLLEGREDLRGTAKTNKTKKARMRARRAPAGQREKQAQAYGLGDWRFGEVGPALSFSFLVFLVGQKRPYVAWPAAGRLLSAGDAPPLLEIT